MAVEVYLLLYNLLSAFYDYGNMLVYHLFLYINALLLFCTIFLIYFFIFYLLHIYYRADFNYAECKLSSEKSRTECENQKQYDKATDVLKETKDALPAKKSNELLQQLIYIASTSANDTERLNKLDELAKEIKQNSGANHLTYFRLSNSYRPVDKLAALKYMRKAKELYENQDKNSSNYDIDSYDFDRNIEDIQAEINAKKD